MLGQAGKTTFARSLLPLEYWAVDHLHHDAQTHYLKDPSQLRAEAETKITAGADVVFFDEVQR
ncbi:MAG: hypothetical protein ABSH28_01835 [Acidobacteriota bacterium]|jgi:hypothetical protein